MNEILAACRSEGDEYDNYLLAENGERMKFPTKEHAIRYLRAHGLSDEEISLHSFIYTNESGECECHLCEKRDDCFIAYKFQRLPEILTERAGWVCARSCDGTCTRQAPKIIEYTEVIFMPKKRILTPEDIAYTIIREWEEDGYKCGEIRNKKSGATAICRIPIRTPEEERKALGPFVRAACRMCNPDVEELGVCTFINDLDYAPEELYPPEELKRRGLA